MQVPVARSQARTVPSLLAVVSEVPSASGELPRLPPSSPVYLGGWGPYRSGALIGREVAVSARVTWWPGLRRRPSAISPT
ncbi:hypothetical protein SMICM304S_09657 [Streptomyces microflavus]